MINFNIEWYGRYARPGALCDYLELLAWAGHTFSVEEVADFVRDSEYTGLLRDQISSDFDHGTTDRDAPDTDPDLSESVDASADVVNNAVAEFYERREILQDGYPYIVGPPSRSIIARGEKQTHCPYDSLLTLSVAHATKARITGVELSALFEQIVEACFESFGIRTALLNNGANDYPSRVQQAARHVGLSVNVANASYRQRAIDDGTDLISNFWPLDVRPGGVQLIGQATCAKSDEWHNKMTEAKPAHWSKMMGTGPEPIRYLAVPHHVDSRYRRLLLERENDTDIVDRLRLALPERDLLADESRVCDYVCSQQVETFV
ncbi:hypothetical protein [Candidatus Poriferisodalis sp.]|uniref:hypothetical protein n=1 Tax=Candidatus Poriferisodalis sp. TaxID=3101277 RepID=UPI003B01CE7B